MKDLPLDDSGRRTRARAASPANGRVLGFDPGLERTGYGVLEIASPRPRIVEAGVLRIPRNGTLAERLGRLFREARDLIADCQPGSIAVEELFSHYERPKTAILMGHARGVLFLAAAQAGLEVASYLPTRVKKHLTGSGHASKQQMQMAIRLQFALNAAPEPPDVADALAVALCHLHALRRAS